MKNIQSDKRLLPILRKRVNSFLNNRSLREIRFEKIEIYSKAVIMFCLLLLPFLAMFLFEFSSWQTITLAIVAGIGMAGVGFNVMHDAAHGAFSKNKTINNIMAGSMYLIAGNVYNWEEQHNVIHHSETNIDGHDDDIDTKGLFRFSEHQPWKRGHRFQFLYALPLYCLMTIMWATTKDWFQMRRYFKDNKTISDLEKNKQWRILFISKILYFTVWVGLPLLFWNNSLDVLIFLGMMHLVGGLITTVVFQLAHVVPKAQMYESKHTKDQWVIHQLLTSCNFATNSRFMTWYLGGLNRQKEHHIFPTKRHTTYKKMEGIVRDFCKEINIPYTEYKTFLGAFIAHIVLLYQLGRKPVNI